MKHTALKAPYKRHDNPGQMLLDFGVEAKPAPAPPPERIAPLEICLPVEEIKILAPENEPLSFTLADESLPAEIKQLALDSRPVEHEFLTDARAAEIIEKAGREFRPGDIRGVRVKFLPFRATLYSFKLDRSRVAVVKFHVAFRRAGEQVVFQAAKMMLCRSRAMRLTLERGDYDQFVHALPPTEFKLPGARRAQKKSSGAQGTHRHLDECFHRVNETYFKAQLKKPELCWSPVRARRILGSYQERSDRLIISRVFDTPAVPLFVLDYLMYHELLHKFLGIGRRGDGKRCIHGAEFKKLEERFEFYEEAQAYIRKKL